MTSAQSSWVFLHSTVAQARSLHLEPPAPSPEPGPFPLYHRGRLVIRRTRGAADSLLSTSDFSFQHYKRKNGSLTLQNRNNP